ncbi:hypothetical protein Rumeso_03837 [Rubellimicrobium mesophilum DSM 19309]|uniref:Uncharacterized protein n=1 Tax=Rubellimicrobium mesophilum DSM 19309 TaxID=442562 RepID=A0A017HJP3_9RHOB|nr:hypothetical protein Rumeso_03837 [Rubellimicrobium mesophilum DSM 19309]
MTGIGSEGLTGAEVEHFIEQGFVRLDGAFGRELAGECRAELWAAMGLSPDRPEGWTRLRLLGRLRGGPGPGRSRHGLPVQSVRRPCRPAASGDAAPLHGAAAHPAPGRARSGLSGPGRHPARLGAGVLTARVAGACLPCAGR